MVLAFLASDTSSVDAAASSVPQPPGETVAAAAEAVGRKRAAPSRLEPSEKLREKAAGSMEAGGARACLRREAFCSVTDVIDWRSTFMTFDPPLDEVLTTASATSIDALLLPGESESEIASMGGRKSPMLSAARVRHLGGRREARRRSLRR